MAIRKPVSGKSRAPRQRRPAARKRKLNIFERIVEIGKTIPEEDLARMPTDGALNFDHYVDGSPKQY